MPMRDRTGLQPLQVEESFGYLIYRSARLLRYHFNHFSAELQIEMTQEQFFIINKLGKNPDQSQTELGDDMLADRPNMTRMIAAMEAKGWLRRKVDPTDGRRFQVSLTRKGTLIHQKIRDAIGAERSRLTAGLSERELADLRRILGKMEQNVMGMLQADAVETVA